MITADQLTKRYGSTTAVDDLSFEVKSGVVTGFLGPNGAGKSTTLRMVLGLDAPTSGSVVIDGKPYRSLRNPLCHVGAMLEAGAVHDGRSAFNHLLSIAQSNGIGRKRVAEVLDIVGLTNVAKRRAGQFSLGMSQRLGIGVALLGDPQLLIFDEPVNGLDPDGIIWIRNLMRSLAAEGRTVFVSSHLMSEMALTAESVIVIGKGRLLAETSIDALIHGSSQNFVRVRSERNDTLEPVFAAKGGTSKRESDGALAVTGITAAAIGEIALAMEVALTELSPQEASLEEAYMELTRDSVEYLAGVPGSRAPIIPPLAGKVA
ncbi:MAG: ATP-binding cassette domain-containing protein [Acidimicrobiales bacterium]|nr:ATP-binding cassette domain-containing protein [Acidimicrobiales bacterium]